MLMDKTGTQQLVTAMLLKLQRSAAAAPFGSNYVFNEVLITRSNRLCVTSIKTKVTAPDQSCNRFLEELDQSQDLHSKVTQAQQHSVRN